MREMLFGIQQLDWLKYHQLLKSISFSAKRKGFLRSVLKELTWKSFHNTLLDYFMINGDIVTYLRVLERIALTLSFTVVQLKKF